VAMLLGVHAWTLAASAQPVTFFLIDATVLAIILARRR